ncbi:DUF2167 domain-containing protein [Cohnella soli]|uniref:DUF2167 domain-containing protein n=1 Tax=Cohnella soli TaxID=425005 RepID=A0ABW0HIZ4_9BACL
MAIQSRKARLIGTILCLVIVFAMPLHAFAEDASELQWVTGNGEAVEVGDNLAKQKLLEGYSFLNADDTKQFEKENGGVPSGAEIGMISPDNGNWAVFLEYDNVGHISDDDKTSIDADELLQSYKDGTEEANKELNEEDRLFVDGWDITPHYDESLHNLTWSIIAHDANLKKLINYNVRVLTREGYVSVILVSDPEHLNEDRKQMEADVLSGLSINEGKRYEDYNASTDKKSKMGLAALVVGGAGVVVAKKVGLLAIILLGLKKFGIVIVAVGAGLWRWIRSKLKFAKQSAAESSGPNSETKEDEEPHASA